MSGLSVLLYAIAYKFEASDYDNEDDALARARTLALASLTMMQVVSQLICCLLFQAGALLVIAICEEFYFWKAYS